MKDMSSQYVQDERIVQSVVAAYTLFIYPSFKARSVDVYRQSLAPRHRFQFGLSRLLPLLNSDRGLFSQQEESLY
jgi:hypothetical protein